MGSSNTKCQFCKVKVSKTQLLAHQRVCKAEDILKKTKKTCTKCNLILDLKEYEDHMICHTLAESENNEIIPQQHFTINYICNNNNSNQARNDTNTYSNQNENLVRSNIGINSSNNFDLRDNLRRRNTAAVSMIPSTTQRRSFLEINNINRSNNALEEELNDNQNIRNIYTLRSLLNSLSESINDTNLRQRDHGVNPYLLGLIPETILKDVDKLPEEKRNCVVCMCQFEKNDKIITIPCCHLYHSKCILDWFKTRNTCPICNFKVDKKGLGV